MIAPGRPRFRDYALESPVFLLALIQPSINTSILSATEHVTANSRPSGYATHFI
jgi:hypothetical protein